MPATPSQRVGNGARLLENFLLHVVAIRPEVHCAAVGVDGAHRAIGLAERFAAATHNPVAAALQVGNVAFFEVDDLVGDARQRHGIARQEVRLATRAHTQHQRRAGTGAHHAVGFILVHHGNGVSAAQLGNAGLHGGKQVAAVVVVDVVGNDFGVGLAGKHVTARLQTLAQLLVVFNDAVVHHGDAAGLRGGARHATVAEMGMGVVHRGRAVRGPTGVGNAGAAAQVLGAHLFQQLGHALGAARAHQASGGGRVQAGGVNGNTAGVVAAVFQPLQALDERGNDVMERNCANDSAHGKPLLWKEQAEY
jgi:hypothetical protein